MLGLHGALAENLVADPGDEGSLRRRIVRITGTTYVPVAIPQVIEEHFELFLEKVGAIPDPFERSFFAMVHIPYLQPFADVNKRTSRLAANIPLIEANLCPLSFVDVPHETYIQATIGVYELRRVELLRDLYAWAYARSCARFRIIRDAMGEPDPLRLRYRAELGRAMRDLVRAGAAPRKAVIRHWGEQHGIDPAALDDFTERALELLLNLQEGSAARYDISPDEMRAWRAKFREPKSDIAELP